MFDPSKPHEIRHPNRYGIKYTQDGRFYLTDGTEVDGRGNVVTPTAEKKIAQPKKVQRTKGGKGRASVKVEIAPLIVSQEG